MRLVKSNEDSLVLLDDFISNNIHNYSSKRNFDFGPKDRSNVSQMSPYISHRILTEYDVVKRVLQKKPYRNVEKYIQEVFWRLYWRGWLESRPRVWDDFMGDLKFIEKNKPDAIISADIICGVISINIARSLRIKIPDELSVVGFGDKTISEYSSPKLTTIYQHGSQIGNRSVELLVDRMNSKWFGLEKNINSFTTEIIPTMTIGGESK